MIETLNQLDTQLFFFFNSHHTPFWDDVMYFISSKKVWYPFYAVIILAVVWQFRKISWIIILAAILAIGASDYVTSGIMKPTFERYRPSRNEALMEKVHIVNNYRGGRFGFASSHAANTFALATFFFLLWRNKLRWMWLLFVWALIVSYSRIYLGVHFPGDIIIGGLIGLLFGWLCYNLVIKIIRSKFSPTCYSGLSKGQ